MTGTPKLEILHRRGLGDDEIAAVRELGANCEAHDGIDLRVSWEALGSSFAEPPHSFLAFRDGTLAGFLMFYGLGEGEAEGTGMIHPDRRREGIFRALVGAAQNAGGQATSEMIVYADRRSAAVPACMHALGAEHAFAETRMQVDTASEGRGAAERLDLRPATAADAPAVAAILADDMEADAGALQHVVLGNMQKPAYRFFIATLNGAPVGTLNIQTIDGDRYIYGFVVRPAFRGQGYGREILARILRDLAAAEPGPVFLEVETENTPAITLYRSLGFLELVTYDYYRLGS